MGLDCYSKLIVGKKLIRKDVQESVTRYNEETGKPFLTVISEKVWFYEDGTEYHFENDEDEDLHSSYMDNDSMYVGYVIAKTESHRHTEPVIKVDLLDSSTQSLQERFRKAYSREPDFYLITVLSY